MLILYQKNSISKVLFLKKFNLISKKIFTELKLSKNKNWCC